VGNTLETGWMHKYFTNMGRNQKLVAIGAFCLAAAHCVVSPYFISIADAYPNAPPLASVSGRRAPMRQDLVM
jgi:hypothetical protein